MKEKVIRFNNDWKSRRSYEEKKKKEKLNETFNTKEKWHQFKKQLMKWQGDSSMMKWSSKMQINFIHLENTLEVLKPLTPKRNETES